MDDRVHLASGWNVLFSFQRVGSIMAEIDLIDLIVLGKDRHKVVLYD